MPAPNPQRSCVQQLVSRPAPRDRVLARRAARYLFPTWQMVLVVVMTTGLVTCLAPVATLAYVHLAHPADPHLAWWMGGAFVLAGGPALWWAMGSRRLWARLARDGSIAKVRVTAGQWSAELDGQRYDLAMFGKPYADPVLHATTKVLVHPALRVGGILDETGVMTPCRVAPHI